MRFYPYKAIRSGPRFWTLSAPAPRWVYDPEIGHGRSDASQLEHFNFVTEIRTEQSANLHISGGGTLGTVWMDTFTWEIHRFAWQKSFSHFVNSLNLIVSGLCLTGKSWTLGGTQSSPACSSCYAEPETQQGMGRDWRVQLEWNRDNCRYLHIQRRRWTAERWECRDFGI